MDLSVLVVSWNTRDLLRDCLASIPDSCGSLNYEVIVVDNGSSDGSSEMVAAQFPRVRLTCNSDNLGFAGANNQAITVSSGRHLLLLNSDARLLPGAAELMVSFMDAHPDVGIVGGKILNPDGSFQSSYADFPRLLTEFLLLTRLSRWTLPPSFPSYPEEKSTCSRAADWVGGAFLMARRTAVTAVGGLDEDYFMYCEEMDWCYRMRTAGWGVRYLPGANAVHWSGASSSYVPVRKRVQLYRSKWLFFRKHRGHVTAASFRLLVRLASYAKMAAWMLASVGTDSNKNALAWDNVVSYRHLLADL